MADFVDQETIDEAIPVAAGLAVGGKAVLKALTGAAARKAITGAGARFVAGAAGSSAARKKKEAPVKEDWQKTNKKDKVDGMGDAAIKAYRRENPGSKLKGAVTGNPKKGSKDASRRANYCSRSKGQQDMHNIDCSKDPDKAICKARRRWKC